MPVSTRRFPVKQQFSRPLWVKSACTNPSEEESGLQQVLQHLNSLLSEPMLYEAARFEIIKSLRDTIRQRDNAFPDKNSLFG